MGSIRGDRRHLSFDIYLCNLGNLGKHKLRAFVKLDVDTRRVYLYIHVHMHVSHVLGSSSAPQALNGSLLFLWALMYSF